MIQIPFSPYIPRIIVITKVEVEKYRDLIRTKMVILDLR